MSATEYIAIDNTPLRPGVHVDGRSGVARLVMPISRVTTCVCFNYVKCKHFYIPSVFVALGAVARVNQVIPYILPEYIPGMAVWWLSAVSCPLVGLGGGWGHG